VKKLFYFSAVLVLILYSCAKTTPPAPAPPVISYSSFTTSDANNAVFTFNFTDADGDIGLNQNDTTGPYAVGTYGYYDFYMRYYCWSQHANTYVTYFRVFPNLSAFLDSAIVRYRIPFIVNNTKNKGLDGQVIINLAGYKPPRQDANDDSTMIFRYEFWMYDRALHKSNVVTTPSFTTPY
jgi:hypothetical protein